jgi:3-deoxy-D-manno-octulosonic-acid transferase
MENFLSITDRWLRDGAAIQISDESELESAVARLLEDPEARAEMARRAATAIAPHVGATERTARIIEKLGVEKTG